MWEKASSCASCSWLGVLLVATQLITGCNNGGDEKNESSETVESDEPTRGDVDGQTGEILTEPCSLDQRRVGEECVEQRPSGTQCDADYECASGKCYELDDGRSVCALSSGMACWYGDPCDCAMGRCNHDTCSPDRDHCPRGTTCVYFYGGLVYNEGSCGILCDDERSCGPGESCLSVSVHNLTRVCRAGPQRPERPDDWACQQDNECESGVCCRAVLGSVFGQCKQADDCEDAVSPGSLAIGEFCARNSDCKTGLCQGTCTAPVDLGCGEPCEDHEWCESGGCTDGTCGGCELGETCKDDSHCSSRVCDEICLPIRQNGELCEVNSQCESNLCVASECIEKRFANGAECEVSEQCNSTICCHIEDEVVQHCAEASRDCNKVSGEVCSSSIDCVSDHCEQENPNEGYCQAFCESDADCGLPPGGTKNHCIEVDVKSASTGEFLSRCFPACDPDNACDDFLDCGPNYECQERFGINANCVLLEDGRAACVIFP